MTIPRLELKNNPNGSKIPATSFKMDLFVGMSELMDEVPVLDLRQKVSLLASQMCPRTFVN
jgi:hypothetical protein